jgi:hypothetical protein
VARDELAVRDAQPDEAPAMLDVIEAAFPR